MARRQVSGNHWKLAIIWTPLLAFGIAALPMRSGRGDVVYPPGSPTLGARQDPTGTNVGFRLCSSRATRVEVYLYDKRLGADEKARFPLAKDEATDVWAATVSVAALKERGIEGTIYYGFRAWGPNWKFDPAWDKGSEAGFVTDVDEQGNRFNPNKLLIDPYATELSHDPVNPSQPDGSVYASGPDHRKQDTGRFAPKGIVLPPDTTPVGKRPTRPLKDEIIYEVHLRGMTKLDPSVPEEERGTYAGAARKADYLKELGVTAVEFLPVHESQNDQNDIPGEGGANYWGYATLAFFAPDRRYARDQSPGGPTREFKAMVKAFHDRDIKVYLDVVYNHTGEGGLYGGDRVDTVNILSWRGLDNPTYYELTEDNRYYYDNTGVNGNFNAANPVVRNLIMDSLRYWSQVMGADGFRFDLAPILGNTLTRQRPGDHQGFIFDKMPGDNVLNRAVRELPGRPAAGGAGVDLIAEPWGASGNTQQQGQFPWGWAEWNDRFRDGFRKSQNRLGIDDVTPGELATRLAGSRDLFQGNGRKPWHSINYLASHDGLCLRDLYTYTDGGQKAWNQGGDQLLQRQATRNGFAFPLLSAGVPMFTGGDEMYRTQNGNANGYNQDNATNYLNWGNLKTYPNHVNFARRLIAFRRSHPALRPAEYFEGRDHNGSGLKDLTFYRDDGAEPDADYYNAKDRHFLAYRIDGTEFGDPAQSIYVGYNGWWQPIQVTLPVPSPGRSWYRAGDTASWMEPQGNFKDPGQEDRLTDRTYGRKGRTLLILIEK
jgi:glycogen operon protein